MIRLLMIFSFTCVMGLFFQAALIHSSIPAAPAPDFILILVVITALNYQNVFGMIGAFVLGLLADFASGLFIGPNAAGAVVAFSLIGVIASRVYADRGFGVMLITFFSCLVKSAVYAIMHVVYINGAMHEILQLSVLKLVLIEAALTALVAPLLYRLMQTQLPRASASSFR